MSLYTGLIGTDRVLKITHLDTRPMVAQLAWPPVNPTTTRELTYRRIE